MSPSKGPCKSVEMPQAKTVFAWWFQRLVRFFWWCFKHFWDYDPTLYTHTYYIYYIYYICIYTVFLGGGFSSSRWIASGFSLCGFVWKWGYHSAYFHRNPSLFAISMTGLRSSKMTGSQLSCSVMKTTGAAWRPPIYGNPWLAIRNSNSSYWQSRMKQHMGVIQHSFRWMIGHGFFKLRWPKPLWTLADWSVIVYGKPWVFLWTLEGKAQHKAGVPKDG